MAKNVGLLVVDGELNPNRLEQILTGALSLVSRELYLFLRPLKSEDQSNDSLKQFISLIYSYTSPICPNLCVYICLPPFISKICDCDVIITVKIDDRSNE
ncbi:unnamed protein product, partial [Hymenolepis diminuta]